MMFIEPPTPMQPSSGRPACSATLLRPPSAPTRYFERTSNSRPDRRSRQTVVTPSASCVWPRYSVDMRAWVPRAQAVLNRIGSMNVWGRSFISHGLDSRCSALECWAFPQVMSRPSSTPASELQKTLLSISACGVACIMASASTSRPRSRSTSMVRWLVICARGVLASQR